MDNTRRMKFIVRWAIVTTLAAAAFWTVWWLVAGSVPVVHAVKMTPSWTVMLPLSVSRWWDVAMAPVWSTAVVLLVTNDKFVSYCAIRSGVIVSFATGIFLGLIAVLSLEFKVGLALSFAVVLTLGITACLSICWANYFADQGFLFGLAQGLALGLVRGLVFGLAGGLAFGLVLGLIIGSFCSTSFWRAIGRWLTVKDK